MLTVGLQSVAGAESVTATITTGIGNLPLDVAVNSAGTVAYVANSSSNTVSVINLPAYTLAATITLHSGSTGPDRVAIDPAGNYAYVSNYTSDNVTVIKLSDNSIFTTIALPSGSAPEQIAVNSSNAYVTDRGTNSVSVIALPGDTVTTPITGLSAPEGIVINSTDAYVTNRGGTTVSVIDLSTNTVGTPITVGTAPSRIALDPVNNNLYVTNTGSSNVSVISLPSDAVSTITVGTTPDAVAVDPLGNYALVSNSGSGTVSVIQLSPDAVVATITVGTTPEGIAVNPAGTFAYVANLGDNSVSVIQLSTNTVTFNANGGTNSMTPQVSSVPASLTTNTFARTNYTFAGWSTVVGGGGNTYTDGQSYPFIVPATLYAEWTPSGNFSVTFNGNGFSSGTMPNEIANGSTALTANAFLRTNYTFAGWNTAANGSGTPYADLASYPFSASTTLYAQWTALDTVTFNTQGGSAVAPMSGPNNSTITLPAGPTRAGYVFNGWFAASSGGTALTSPYTLTGSATLYAQWTANASDTVTFNTQGGSAVASMSGPNGSTITLPAAPTRAGYSFNGWFAASSGGTALTSPYTLAGTVILYAQWTANASDTVTFNTQGGSAVASMSGPNNSTITLPAGPTRAGYVFNGWFTASSGGTALTSPYTLTGTVILYAQWTLNSGGGGVGGGGTTLNSLTITASSVNVTVGGTISPTASVTSGLAAGDTATVGSVTLTYAGTGTTVYAASTTAPSAAGTYSVTPSAATVTISPSTDVANYSTTYSYVGGTVVISPSVVTPPPPPPSHIVVPHASRLVGIVVVGTSRRVTIIGTGFAKGSHVRSTEKGAVVRVISVSANRIVLLVTVRKGQRPSRNVFIITAASTTKACRIVYVTKK